MLWKLGYISEYLLLWELGFISEYLMFVNTLLALALRSYSLKEVFKFYK